jgi:DNA-binding response OmpR family regulator
VSARIGLLEDDQDQAQLYEVWLGKAGYQTRAYHEAAEFRRRLAADPMDLLLLDWELPGTSGIEVLRWLRENGDPNLPVIFITVRDSEEDIVEALRHGADDYLIKPLRAGELLARISAVLRRAGIGSDEQAAPTQMGPYALDPERHRVLLNGQEVPLTQREYELAAYLFRRQGRIVSREALLEDVWKIHGDVVTRTVDTHISRLRRKLELGGEHGWRLTAIYQHGYRLEPC